MLNQVNFAADKQRDGQPDEWVEPRRRHEQQHVRYLAGAVCSPIAPQAPWPLRV